MPRFLAVLALGAVFGCRREEGPPDPLHEARLLYASSCARCHGIDGKGGVPALGGKAPRNLTDPAFQRARTDAELLAAISQGKGEMPAFGKLYRPKEIEDLVSVVRGFDRSRQAPPASSGSPR